MIYDVLVILCIGIGHIYLFHLLLGNKNISIRFVVVTAFLFTLFLIVILNSTGFVESNIVILFIFLLVLGILYKSHTIGQIVYFALLSIVLFTVVKNSLFTIFYWAYMESSFNYYIWTPSAISLVTLLVVLGLLFVLKNYIKVAGTYILHSRFFYVTYGLVVICTLLLTVVNYPTLTFLAKTNQLYGEQLYTIILLVVVVLLLILTIKTYFEKERLLEKHAQTEYEQLITYVEKLEFLHDELSSFRHDYTNLLLSLEQSIKKEDIEQVKQIYISTIAPTVSVLNLQQLELTKLARVEQPELKSLLSVKVLAAQRQSVAVYLDIPHTISHITLPSDELIRIFSVLIDNAIEESVKSKEKMLQIAIFEMDEAQYIVVKNSVCDPKELTTMYRKYVSTKGEKRGIGLFSVQRMLKKHPSATLLTKMDASFFTQELIIKQLNRS